MNTEKCKTAVSEINLYLLRTSLPSASHILPYVEGPLQDVVVDPLGVQFQESGEIILFVQSLSLVID